jgi:hypothetical protein
MRFVSRLAGYFIVGGECPMISSYQLSQLISIEDQM